MASCLGSSAKYAVIDILSRSLGANLRVFLDQAVQKGFMVKVDNTCIRFSHDKIQQAAYEMMSIQERLQNHMRFGLTICSHAVNSAGGNDELLFAAINQINRGGPDSLPNPNRKAMVGSMNLRAGRRSMELSDFSTALKLFEHGIMFLDDDDRWRANYRLSLDLFDGAVEVACALNNAATVGNLSREVAAHARCDDDKLNCLYAVAKSLRLALKFAESKKFALQVLSLLGERVPRPSDDIGLLAELEGIKFRLRGMSDESILNLPQANQTRKDALLLNLYNDLTFLFQSTNTKQLVDVGLRMVQVTLSNGLSCMSPLAFTHFSNTLVMGGETTLGHRVSRLALKLLDRVDAKRYTSAVISLLGVGVSWVAEPLQSMAESHLIGYHHGQRGGDVMSTTLNYLLYLQVTYLSGQNLSIVRDKSRAFALELLQRKQQFLIYSTRILYLQTIAFMEGLDFEVEDEGALRALPTWDNIKEIRAAGTKSVKQFHFSLMFASHQYTRYFLFKQFDKLPEEGVLDRISEKTTPLRPTLFYGVFFEALIFFHLLRQTHRDEYRIKGEAAMMFMRKWSKFNEWNFENKYLLLEAEMMYSSGYHEQAAQLYEQSILSANKHKFVHDEAIACEAAATFYYERGVHQKAYPFFMRSVHCYKKWGAMAVASRVSKMSKSNST
ncbi:hypothetical protein ACHAWF_004756 [Thalassiosira exigua]